MSEANLNEQLIFVVTVLYSENTRNYESVCAAFVDERDARERLKELTAELHKGSGTQYFIEETWLYPRATLPEMSEG